jgi:hypothetical protein
LTASDKSIRVFTQLPQATSAQFLQVSDSVVSECQHQAEAVQSEKAGCHFGHPAIIPEADERAVLEQIRVRILSNNGPIMRDVKEQILHGLEVGSPDVVPSKRDHT